MPKVAFDLETTPLSIDAGCYVVRTVKHRATAQFKIDLKINTEAWEAFAEQVQRLDENTLRSLLREQADATRVLCSPKHLAKLLAEADKAFEEP